MTQKALADIVAREFAHDDGFLAEGASKQGLVDTALNLSPGTVRPLDFPDRLTAPAAATSVDEALDVRQTLAREES
jgi:hypothetical protein